MKKRSELVRTKRYPNIMAVPSIVKVVINAGVGNGATDAVRLEALEKILMQISGQKAVVTQAKKAISNFGIRKGDAVGVMVTLRGVNMWCFLEKFISAVLPRTRDFRGIKESQVDQGGNLNFGIKEHNVFLEIDPNEVEKSQSMQVTIVLKNANHAQAIEFYRGISIPFIE